MCREEKRFYQRENERQLNIYKRQEAKRVRSLVDRAQTNDPRLRKKREEEEAKRLKEKEEREAEKRRLREEEERRRAEIAEKDRQAEEERHRKIMEAKNAVKNSLATVTAFLKDHNLLDSVATNMVLPNLVRQPNIQWYFSKASPEEAIAMQEAVCGGASTAPEGSSAAVPAVTAFNAKIEEKEQKLGITRYGEPVKKAAVPAPSASPSSKAKANPSLAQWADEDIILLRQAIAKFPGGTVDRWRRIVVMMRSKFTEEEVLVKTKELEGHLRSGVAPTKVASADLPSTITVSGAAQPPAAAAASAHLAAAAATAAAAAVTPPVEDWTPKQQKQLEEGLRTNKDYKEKDKFQKVAAFVDGKTAKQCFERFKHLCSLQKK